MRETFGNYLSGHKHIQTSLVPIVSKSIMVVVVVVEDDVVVVDPRKYIFGPKNKGPKKFWVMSN